MLTKRDSWGMASSLPLFYNVSVPYLPRKVWLISSVDDFISFYLLVMQPLAIKVSKTYMCVTMVAYNMQLLKVLASCELRILCDLTN